MIYVGQKKSQYFLGNTYLGSGKHLKHAVAYYGKKNFIVEMLEAVDDVKDMDEKEIYWIKCLDATNPSVGYNISSGGLVNRAMQGERNPRYGKHMTEEEKERQRKGLANRDFWGDNNPARQPGVGEKISKKLLGHTVSEESRQKLAFYNTHRISITNGVINKTILSEDFEKWRAVGFIKGRIRVASRNAPTHFWYTDGNVYMHIDVGEIIPEGFKLVKKAPKEIVESFIKQ